MWAVDFLDLLAYTIWDSMGQMYDMVGHAMDLIAQGFQVQ